MRTRLRRPATPPVRRRIRSTVVVLGTAAVSLAAAGCGGPPAAPGSAGHPARPALRVGGIFPLSGTTARDAGDELRGASIAAQMVNQDGGVEGRRVSLDLRDVDSPSQVGPAVAGLHRDGVPVVIGAYSSSLSIPAAAAVSAQGMVYWETGAVADQVTGRGSPLVFRVGADGADLGTNSGRFVVSQLAPRLGRPAGQLTAFLVTVDDAYGHSVADAARTSLAAGGVQVLGEVTYRDYLPDWPQVISEVRSARPDILVLTSHVPDGVAFRRAFLAAGLHVDAFIGTTMAQCADFGAALGAQAVGVFASDRPDYGFNQSALTGGARALYDRFESVWQRQTGHTPTEEGISGFAAAWALFHDTLPRAAQLDPPGIARAARTLDLPQGSLPNGAGVRFSAEPDQLGQNVRAAADIWQWQAPRRYAVVWPAAYATGGIELNPPRRPPAPTDTTQPATAW